MWGSSFKFKKKKKNSTNKKGNKLVPTRKRKRREYAITNDIISVRYTKSKEQVKVLACQNGKHSGPTVINVMGPQSARMFPSSERRKGKQMTIILVPRSYLNSDAFGLNCFLNSLEKWCWWHCIFLMNVPEF